MRVIIQDTSEQASQRAAQFIARLVRQKPSCVLGLATGTTVIPVYQELVQMHRNEGLDFSRVTTFNLDEYVGLGASDKHSFRNFMQEHLFNQINIPPQQTHVPDGRALDFAASCLAYEHRIEDSGGIDLQVLGIGSDGHIAFNEPGSSLGSRTRLKTLASETVKDNARFFDSIDQVPRLAITMGVGTILESKQCLLIALDERKAKAVRDTIEGPITAQVTASALQLHRDVVVVLDEQAASLLRRRDYYEEVEYSQRLLEQGKLRQLGIGR